MSDINELSSNEDLNAKPRKTMSPEHKAKLQAARQRSHDLRRQERAARALPGGGATAQVREQEDRMERPVRKHFGTPTYKLDAPTRAGYHRCWMNDDGSVEKALECGYKFVQALGTHTKSSEVGSKERRLAGRGEGGQPLYCYLMEIPQDWYEEAQAELEKQNAAVMAAIRGGNIQGRVGHDGRYVPSTGIKVDRKNTPT